MHLVWNKSVFYWASHAFEWNPICSKKNYILRWFESLDKHARLIIRLFFRSTIPEIVRWQWCLARATVDLWISASPKWLMVEIHWIYFLPAKQHLSFNRSGLLYLTNDEGNGDENDDNDDLNVRKCNPLKSGANGIFRKSWETFEIHIFSLQMLYCLTHML